MFSGDVLDEGEATTQRAVKARLGAALLFGAGCVAVAAMTAGAEAGVKNGQTGLRLAEPLALASQGDPVVAAAGDIACDPAKSNFNNGEGSSSSCKQKAVSDLLVNQGLAAVMPLGDNQYYCGSLQAYQESYDLSWGRVKDITYPAVGNHEYITSTGSERTGCDSSNTGAAGHYGYFGSAAGDPDKGYYSYDVGTWHVIVLNSNCSKAGGCTENTPQGQWLRADLAAHPNTCTLAYWHQPLFSSGGRDNDRYKTFWDALYEADADVVLASHDHTYERFAKQTPDGVADPVRGIRSFIVGTGGANHTSFVAVRPNSEVREDRTYGVLKLTLHPTSYTWNFVPIAGQTFTDTGTDQCHGGSGDTEPPTAPSGLDAQVDSPTQVSLSWTGSTDNVDVLGYRVYRNGTEIGTSQGTTFTDDTADPESSYDYVVRAYDAGNNLSDPSNTASVTTPAVEPPPPGATTVILNPVADTFVRSDRATTSYGSNTSLDVDGSPQKETLIKFTVAEGDPVIDATLRLHAIDKSNQGGFVHPTGNGWSEGTTWNNRPSATGSDLGSFGPVAVGSWYELDVSTYVDADGTYSFLIDSPSSNGADFSSSDGSAALRPELVLTVDSGGPPPPGDTEAPSAPGNLAGVADSSTQVSLTWDASTDNVGVTGYVVSRGGTEIGSPSGTSFTDTSAVPDTTTTYSVVAEDAAGNTSAASTVDVTTPADPPPPPGTTVTLLPDVDTFVRSDRASTSYGGNNSLDVDGSPQKESYLRFTVAEGQPITAATLRLHCVDKAKEGGDFFPTDNAWSGSTTWNDRPVATGPTLGSLGVVDAGSWYEVDVSALVQGDGTYNVLISSGSSNGADYSSLDGPAGLEPQLVLEVG